MNEKINDDVTQTQQSLMKISRPKLPTQNFFCMPFVFFSLFFFFPFFALFPKTKEEKKTQTEHILIYQQRRMTEKRHKNIIQGIQQRQKRREEKKIKNAQQL